MKTRKKARCFSERMLGRNFFLSFLALSNFPPGSAYQHEQQPIPPLANLAILPPIAPTQPEIPKSNDRDFTLRHIFHRGTYRYPDLHRRLDIQPPPMIQNDGATISVKGYYTVRSRQLEIQRLVDTSLAAIESHLKTARLTGEPAMLGTSAWTVDEIPGPNVTDRESVVSLARIAANAYVDTPGQGEWEEIGRGYNSSLGFGWEDDGLRGYIFGNHDNSTIIMGLKGTSPAVFDGSETTTNDKLNDNLFFSCCCGQGGQYLWRQVCDCQAGTYTCNQTCLVDELRAENRYYRSSIELYTNVTKMYPNSNIWLTGHSLGGAVSALLGLTFGIPVVAFEAPGDDLPAKRLGLPSPPDASPLRPHVRALTGAYHFGHTADPVFMGSCNGAAATCTFGGYAMESQCHTGNVCIYDTVGDLGWRVGIGNHKIHVVIDSVLLGYDDLPVCRTDNECVDCFNWKYFESNGTDSTTSSSSSTTATKTRTTTCETPGWWGCLDETTTTTTTSTSTSTSTTSTSTCKTPGWFGCKDHTTSTSATATPCPTITTTPTTTSNLPSSTTSQTTTCQTPGWFGCNDPTSSPMTSPTSTHRKHKHHTLTSTCETPGFFWGCRDKSKTHDAQDQHPITAGPTPSERATVEWKQEM